MNANNQGNSAPLQPHTSALQSECSCAQCENMRQLEQGLNASTSGPIPVAAAEAAFNLPATGRAAIYCQGKKIREGIAKLDVEIVHCEQRLKLLQENRNKLVDGCTSLEVLSGALPENLTPDLANALGKIFSA